MNRPSKAQARQREADIVWRVLSIGLCWLVGLLLALPWYRTWLGLAIVLFAVLVGVARGLWKRSWVAAARAGGVSVLVLGASGWLLILLVFHGY